jgi:hypothetical protein
VDGDVVAPEDERRHPPGTGRAWEESWYLDFVAGDGSLGGYVRLSLHPADGQAWFWAGVVGAGPRLVTLRDHEVPLPLGRTLEVRSSGLWTELVCETPLDHWSVGLEAFGVALDDPLEAWGRERGDPWAVGLDVEWEATGPCAPWPGGIGVGYSQPCAVHGDVLVGARRFQLDGSGTRLHLWGDREWVDAPPWSWAAGRLDDGTSFTAVGDDVVVADAPDGLLRTATVHGPDGLELAATAVAHAPVLVPAGGGGRRAARLARALCRYSTADGRRGHGWAERLV